MPAALTLLRADTHRLAHEDVDYEPIAAASTLGALLFALDALDPDAVTLDHARTYADRLAMQPALLAARQFGLILQRHAQRADRSAPRLPASVRVDDLHAWVHAAAVAAPEKEIERFCWRLARRLGPDPWCDGRPAIELQNQQFALFEGGFEETAPVETVASAESIEPFEQAEPPKPDAPAADAP